MLFFRLVGGSFSWLLLSLLVSVLVPWPFLSAGLPGWLWPVVARAGSFVLLPGPSLALCCGPASLLVAGPRLLGGVSLCAWASRSVCSLAGRRSVGGCGLFLPLSRASPFVGGFRPLSSFLF